MADLAALESALVKADAAGNTADAKVFADEIRRLRTAPAPKPVETPQPQTTAGGVASEVGKGLLRGPSELGSSGANMLLGPFMNPVAAPLRAYFGTGPLGSRMESLTAPANQFLKPTPTTPTERFAGTAAELGAAGVAGGGAGSVPGMIGTGLMALGGATGEQMGGETGKLIGSVGSPLAASGAIKTGQWAGRNLANTLATFGAAQGHKPSIERLGSVAAQHTAGETKAQQLAALLRVTEYAPGVKPTAAEAIAEANMGQPSQFGGGTIRLQKDLSGARGLEDVLPSAVRQQNVALAQHLKKTRAEAKPMREAAYQQADAAGGVGADRIISKIDETLEKPGPKADDLVQKTLGAIKEKLASLSDEQGRINIRDIYTVRKKIGTTIGKFSKETADWDKKTTATLERQIQLYIDDAIEKAGATGWKDYLKFFSTGMKAEEQHLARAREAKIIAAGVKGGGGQVVGSEAMAKPPTLLIREMMLTNFVLKMLRQDPNTPVAKYVAEQMRDPKAYAKLLKQIPEPRSTALDAARASAIAAAVQQGQ